MPDYSAITVHLHSIELHSATSGPSAAGGAAYISFREPSEANYAILGLNDVVGLVYLFTFHPTHLLSLYRRLMDAPYVLNWFRVVLNDRRLRPANNSR